MMKRLVALLGIGTSALASLSAQSLTWLGTLGGNESVAYGVSANGIVAGMARRGGMLAQQRAFRWECGSLTDLGTLGGLDSVAHDISADGRVIVGWSYTSFRTNSRAFKHEAGVMTDLGALVANGASGAHGVSADGSVIVGWSDADCQRLYFDYDFPGGCFSTTYRDVAAFRWTSSGMTRVGSCFQDTCEPNVDRGHRSWALSVSLNGQVWVGRRQTWDTSHASGNNILALRNGSDLGGGVAYAASRDGSVVVGAADAMCFHPNRGYYPCRAAHRWPGGNLSNTWVSNPDDPEPPNASAHGVTADGNTIVGTVGGRACRWRVRGNTVIQEDLNQVYSRLLSRNSVLRVAYDISPNGRYIVGVGYNSATQRDEAFLLDTWQSCPRCISYKVLLGDRDLQRGVLVHDNPNDDEASIRALGACTSSGTRYYYGLDVHPITGEIWACDISGRQIVRLSSSGACLQTISLPAGYTGSPTGLSIHPRGRYLHITNQGNRIDAYDIRTGQWVATTFVSNVSSLYGLKWIGESLYVCDFGGKRVLLLVGDPAQPLRELGRTSTPYNPYDVTGYTVTGGRAPIDHVFITQTSGTYGNYAEVSTLTHAWDTPGFLNTPSTIATHPGNNNADGNGSVSFFGIEIDPDRCLLWVSDYIRGDLFTVDLRTGAGHVAFRGSIEAGYKLGLGVAIQTPSTCTAHNGDVNGEGCVDDADLLAILFAFGQTGQGLGRVDVNCDGVVDDADLLTVLFNFGSGC